MNDDDKIDFSSLDPSRDALRWERIVASVIDRALRPRPATISAQLRLWAKPALVSAAAAALLVCLTAILKAGPPEEQPTEPAYVLAQWAANDEIPAAHRILEVLGVNHGE